MLEAKEGAIDVESKVSSYRSGRRPAARPWIPDTGQPMSPAFGAIFSLVTWEQGYVSEQQIVFSQKQEAYGDEAPCIDLRELGFKIEIFSLFKVNFLISFFFIFAPEYGIIAYKFNSVSKKLRTLASTA